MGSFTLCWFLWIEHEDIGLMDKGETLIYELRIWLDLCDCELGAKVLIGVLISEKQSWSLICELGAEVLFWVIVNEELKVWFWLWMRSWSFDLGFCDWGVKDEDDDGGWPSSLSLSLSVSCLLSLFAVSLFYILVGSNKGELVCSLFSDSTILHSLIFLFLIWFTMPLPSTISL